MTDLQIKKSLLSCPGDSIQAKYDEWKNDKLFISDIGAFHFLGNPVVSVSNIKKINGQAINQIGMQIVIFKASDPSKIILP